MVCCQGGYFVAHDGSNGARFFSTPQAISSRLRRHAPTAALFAFPAPSRRS
jgi:hypothetical protein